LTQVGVFLCVLSFYCLSRGCLFAEFEEAHNPTCSWIQVHTGGNHAPSHDIFDTLSQFRDDLSQQTLAVLLQQSPAGGLFSQDEFGLVESPSSSTAKLSGPTSALAVPWGSPWARVHSSERNWASRNRSLNLSAISNSDPTRLFYVLAVAHLLSSY
jgi:hypothetical protein